MGLQTLHSHHPVAGPLEKSFRRSAAFACAFALAPKNRRAAGMALAAKTLGIVLAAHGLCAHHRAEIKAGGAFALTGYATGGGLVARRILQSMLRL